MSLGVCESILPTMSRFFFKRSPGGNYEDSQLPHGEEGVSARNSPILGGGVPSPSAIRPAAEQLIMNRKGSDKFRISFLVHFNFFEMFKTQKRAETIEQIPRGPSPPWRRQWHPTPVFLPRKFHGRRSLVGCHLRGRRVRHDCSDLAAAAASPP